MRAQQCRSWTNENAGYLCLVGLGQRPGARAGREGDEVRRQAGQGGQVGLGGPGVQHSPQ